MSGGLHTSAMNSPEGKLSFLGFKLPLCILVRQDQVCFLQEIPGD